MIKPSIRKIAFALARLAGFERQAVLLGDIRAEQLRNKGKLETLADAEFCVFSQWGEDGILSWLIDRIKPQSQRFVEFGVEDYQESNTRYLMMSRYWSGLIIDGSDSNINAVRSSQLAYKCDLKAVASFITAENINVILANNGFDGPVGILSVDIDGVDYWVLEKIRNDADIIVVEYNDILGPEPLSVPYDAQFQRLKKHWSGMYWGASLEAFRHLLEQRGYVLAGTNRAGTNAFFVAGRHREAVTAGLQSFHVWPSKMREVRNENGSLAFSTYRESEQLIADLPLVNVATGDACTLRRVRQDSKK